MQRTTGSRGQRRLVVSVGVLLLFGVVGCGRDFYPVHGTVTFPDGTPLPGGLVICEMTEGDKTFMARGAIQKDGTFRLSTEKPGDGARPGKYRVLVTPVEVYEPDEARGLRAVPRKSPGIDGRYLDYQTSGLELEVKPGPNEVTLTVTPPGNRSR
jgi:hypothetical protein